MKVFVVECYVRGVKTGPLSTPQLIQHLTVVNEQKYRLNYFAENSIYLNHATAEYKSSCYLNFLLNDGD